MESLIGYLIPYWNFFAKGADEYSNPSAGIPQAFLDEEYKHPLTGQMRPNPLKYVCKQRYVQSRYIAGLPGRVQRQNQRNTSNATRS